MRSPPAQNPCLRFPIALVLLLVTVFSPARAQTNQNQLLPDSTTLNKVTPRPDTSSAKTIKDTLNQAKKNDLTDTVHYEADEIAYDAEERILRLTGHASVRYQSMKLIADTIVYTMADHLFTSAGRPLLIEGSDTTVGDFMVYNIKTRRGRVRAATTHLDNAWFTGQRIVKTKENELYVAQGEYTTCAHPDHPHFFFYGEKIRLKPNDKIICKPVVLNIGDAPVLALPYFIFPVERNRKSGILTPRWGGSPTGGGYIDNLGYYWTPNDYFDFTASARVREFTEFVANMASQYRVRYDLNGGFSSQYAFNSDFLNSRREWSLNYNHSQNLTPDGLTTLSGQGNLVSTKNFYANYSQDSSELREQYLSSNMALNKQFQELKANGSMVWTRRHNLKDGHVESDMPSLNFNLSERPLIPAPEIDEDMEEVAPAAAKKDSLPPWYNNIYWGYSGRGVVKSDAYTDSDTKGFTKPGLGNELRISAPQKLFKYISISPGISGNLSTFYGFIDTAVTGYDSLYDTKPYVTYDKSDTTRFSGYQTISIVDSLVTDSLGWPDTLYKVTRWNPKPTVYPRHDTSQTGITNVYSWRAGISMQTNLYGTFPVRFLNFRGMRHTLTPRLEYNFLPKHDLNKMFFPVGISYTGSQKRQQNVSFSIGNLFEGKVADGETKPGEKAKEKKFTLLNADLSSAYNFEATERKVSPLSLSASTGYSLFGIGYSSTYFMYDNDNRQIFPILQNYSVSLRTGNFAASGKFWDGDRLLLDSLRKADPIDDANAGPQTWRISINPAFSFSANRARPDDVLVPAKNFNLAASAEFGLTRNWRFSWSGNYSPVLDQMVQNSINVSCDLECWDLRLQWRPEKLNPGYYFIINVKEIPEIKWEQRSRY